MRAAAAALWRSLAVTLKKQQDRPPRGWLGGVGFALPSDRRVTTPAPVEDGRAGYIDPDRCQIRRCRSEAAN
jgi:hypothetical protein